MTLRGFAEDCACALVTVVFLVGYLIVVGLSCLVLVALAKWAWAVVFR